MGSVNVSTLKSGIVSVQPRSVKRSNPFTCIGWIRDPFFEVDDSLIVLAVADLNGDVQSSGQAIKFEIIKDSLDYRLRFSNSISKRIDKTLQIKINDTEWHFLSYVCTGDGAMTYYVDGQELPAEDGVGDEGVLYSTAWSRYVRQGGGEVWVPHLYKSGQSVTVYNWRYASDLIIHQQWLNELMENDRQVLFAEQGT